MIFRYELQNEEHILDLLAKFGQVITPNPKTPQPKWHLGMSFKMRSTRSLGPKHCQLPTIVRRVVLSTVTRVFKKRSISQSRELKPLEGNFHFKTLMGTTFSHEKSLQSVLVHRGCHEHFRTQALSTHYIQGRSNRGDQKPWSLPKSNISWKTSWREFLFQDSHGQHFFSWVVTAKRSCS